MTDDEYGHMLRRYKYTLRDIENMTDGLADPDALPKPMRNRLRNLQDKARRQEQAIDAYHDRMERQHAGH